MIRSRRLHLKRQKARGQSLVVMALCMMVMVAVVGLAVDGGALFAERRTAQNGADAMALAGARKMLEIYDSSAVFTFPNVNNGTAQQEQQVKAAIVAYSSRNKTSLLEAYFVNDSKQVVSASLNAFANPPCGTTVGVPCPVGQNGNIPWSAGAKGVMIKGSSETSSFFVGLIGFNRLVASATATGFMGRATSVPNVNLFPIGLYTNTNGIDNLLGTLIGGRTYVLAQVDSRINVGSWAHLDYNGVSDGSVRSSWLECGYNPSLHNDADWDAYCPPESASNGQTWGPTVFWTGANGPDNGPYASYDMRTGQGSDGWWIGGSVGSTRDSCLELANLLNNIEIGRQYLIPIIDSYTGGGGGDRRGKMHLADLGWFSIIRAEVNCHVPNDILNPLAGEHQIWVIVAQYNYAYSAGSAGEHADLAHTSRHTVFLEP